MAVYKGNNLISGSPAVATTTNPGIVQPDGTSITINNGIISASTSGAKLYTLDGLSITSTNVDIRTLVQAVVAKDLPIGSMVTGSVQLTDAPADNATDAMVEIVSYQLTEGTSTDTIYDITFNSRVESPYQWHAEYWVGHPTADVGWSSAPLAFYNMPTASATYGTNGGKVAQYVGPGDGVHITGKFYKCQEVTPVTTPATYEWVLLDISTVKDVQVAGTSVLSSGVANVPYASDSNAGVIKTNVSYALEVNSSGQLKGQVRTYSGYPSSSENMFITKGTLENVITGKGLVSNTDYANTTTGGVIKTNTTYGTSTNSDGVLQAETKTLAEYNSTADTLFIGKGTLNNVITGKGLETYTASITDASTITLANNTIYTASSALTSLTIALPSSYDTKFIAQLNIISGSTATTWSAPATISFLGDDCDSSNVFTPVANKKYSIFIYADSASTCRGVVSAIATA